MINGSFIAYHVTSAASEITGLIRVLPMRSRLVRSLLTGHLHAMNDSPVEVSR